MADLYSLINSMTTDGTIQRIARRPLAQFGPPARRYLGAEILPEREVPENAYEEDQIKYRTVIANSGTRYSPTQKKGSDLVGSFLVVLGESDIAREMDGRQYDALLKVLGQNLTMDGVARVTRWLDTTISRALLELNEKQRWDAIVGASVVRTGDNAYTETVAYSNPAGHRVTAGGTWSSDAYDPFTDIMAQADLLASKGFTVNRIFAGRTIVSILAGNDKVKARTGLPVVNVGGSISIAQQRANIDGINGALSRDGLPPIEQYDLQYRTQTGTGFFLPRDAFVMVATTGQDESLDLGDSQQLVSDTLGYVAIGRAAGQATPGRVIRMEAKADKPPRIEAEGWQTALPVITEPEAIAVISSIA
jgi:hypothetical protein